MNKATYSGRIKINSYNDLFGISDPIKGAATLIKEISLDDLYEFNGHPFLVKDDDKMKELVESIKVNGVLVPGIVRERNEGGYEIIAGHRRRRACELAGLNKMPMFVKKMSDDEAVIIMVDSNFQREDLSVIEKTRAYKMRYDAIKNQGKKGNSLNILEKASGDNKKKIQRYIWLSRLTDDLLKMVDERKIPFTQGVDLSFLLIREQKWVLDILKNSDTRITVKKSNMLKKMSLEKKLDEEMVYRILYDKEEECNRKVVIRSKELTRFFDETYSSDCIRNIVLSLLEEWKKNKM